MVQISGFAVTFGQDTEAHVGIGDSSSAFDYDIRVGVIGVIDGRDTIRREFNVHTSGVYYVSGATTKTFYLLAEKPSVFSSRTVNLGSLNITATYYPRRY